MKTQKTFPTGILLTVSERQRAEIYANIFCVYVQALEWGRWEEEETHMS